MAQALRYLPATGFGDSPAEKRFRSQAFASDARDGRIGSGRSAVLVDGRIVLQGSRDELLATGDVVRHYLGISDAA